MRGPGRASPAVWLAGFAPLAACLAMTHVAVFRLTPNAAGRPSVTSYAYGLLVFCAHRVSLSIASKKREQEKYVRGVIKSRKSVSEKSSRTMSMYDNPCFVVVVFFL